MTRTLARLLGLVAALLLAAPLAATGAAAQETPTLTVLTHWGEQHFKSEIDPQLEACAEQVGVEVEHQTVAFDELLNRITTGRLGGEAPDIYHFYNLWLPEFAASDLLAEPPAEVVADIEEAYTPGSVGGVTYADQVWGYPTEVNTYQLIYNKQLFEEAGVEAPPATWEELREVAEQLTVRDEEGEVTRPAFLLITGWDSGVVHPWTSLLWSNAGEYVAEDYSEVLFDEAPGVETLQLQVDLIESGAVDLGLTMDDFVAGQIPMTIMANWWGSTLREGLPGGIENVGVAPIPATEGNASVPVQYNWLWGVDQNTDEPEAAWAFLQCLNTPADGGASPMGEFLTTGLNAIPARVSDQEAFAERLSDPFVQPFVEALETARTEPIIPGAQEIKTALQKQIEAAWFGEVTAEEALNQAAMEANRILEEKAEA